MNKTTYQISRTSEPTIILATFNSLKEVQVFIDREYGITITELISISNTSERIPGKIDICFEDKVIKK